MRIAGSPFQLLFHQHLAARPRDLVQSFPCCCHPPPSLSSAFHESPPFFFSPRVLTLKVRAVGNPWLRRESILGAGLCTSVIRRHSHTTLKGSAALLQFSTWLREQKEKTKESLDLTIMRACTGSGRRRGGRQMDICCIPEKIRSSHNKIHDTQKFIFQVARFQKRKH